MKDQGGEYQYILFCPGFGDVRNRLAMLLNYMYRGIEKSLQRRRLYSRVVANSSENDCDTSPGMRRGGCESPVIWSSNSLCSALTSRWWSDVAWTGGWPVWRNCQTVWRRCPWRRKVLIILWSPPSPVISLCHVSKACLVEFIPRGENWNETPWGCYEVLGAYMHASGRGLFMEHLFILSLWPW